MFINLSAISKVKRSTCYKYFTNAKLLFLLYNEPPTVYLKLSKNSIKQAKHLDKQGVQTHFLNMVMTHRCVHV